MANRRVEMFQYRQVLIHMRSGQSDRQIANAGLMGRRKAGELRIVAEKQGWLSPDAPLPDDEARWRRPSGESPRKPRPLAF